MRSPWTSFEGQNQLAFEGQLLDAERGEEAVIVAMEMQGQSVQRREDADPRANLFVADLSLDKTTLQDVLRKKW